MQDQLNLVQRLFARGRKLQNLGVKDLAIQVFQSVSNFHQLPKSICTNTNKRLARLHAERRQYRKARRRLAAALLQHPDDSKLHFRMAKLLAKDVFCDPKRAARHFKLALKLDPNNPKFLSAYGSFAIRNDRRKTGLTLLREAFAIAPTNAKVVTRYVQGLQKLDRFTEARQVLKVSRFRLGKCVWFENLARDVEYSVLAKKQRAERQPDVSAEEPFCVLPFPARETKSEPAEELPESYRLDRPSVLSGPHLSAMKRRPDQRHAQ